MNLITKDNLASFIDYYCNFHDSRIININYDINNSFIEMIFKVLWTGKSKIKEDGTYETNKTKLKLSFNNVEKCNMKEIFSWDEINDVYLKYINIDNKEYLCFATDKSEPLIYIACESIEYEEIKDL